MRDHTNVSAVLNVLSRIDDPCHVITAVPRPKRKNARSRADCVKELDPRLFPPDIVGGFKVTFRFLFETIGRSRSAPACRRAGAEAAIRVEHDHALPCGPMATWPNCGTHYRAVPAASGSKCCGLAIWRTNRGAYPGS